MGKGRGLPLTRNLKVERYLLSKLQFELPGNSGISCEIPRHSHPSAFFNPPGTKGFGTHTKHQGGGGVEKDPPSISRTRNATNLKPLEGLGVSFKVSKNFKLV